MVPKFVMPLSMQTLSYLSPMAWALDGLLDVLVRAADSQAILVEVAALMSFGGIALALAWSIFSVKSVVQ
jgi:ABC-2 type transport system permease protein